MRTALLCSAALAAAALHADAAYLRLGFGAQVTQSSQPISVNGVIPSSFGSASGYFTFDTDAPPISTDGVVLTFDVADHDYTYTIVNAGVTSVQHLDPSNSTARIIYKSSNDTLTLQINRTDGGPAVSTSLIIAQPAGGFSASMTTLPDSGYGPHANVSCYVTAQGTLYQALWNAASSSFTAGAIQYTTGGVSAPAPRACSPADLAAPFGQLNFFDVSAFLSAFNAGCP